MRRKLSLFMLLAVIPVLLALIPLTADAQHARGGAAVRSGERAAALLALKAQVVPAESMAASRR